MVNGLAQPLTQTAIGGFQQGGQLAREGVRRNALMQIAPAVQAGELGRAGDIAAQTGDLELVTQIKQLVQQGKSAELAKIRAGAEAVQNTLGLADAARQQNPENFPAVAQALAGQFIQANPESGFSPEQVLQAITDPNQTQAARISAQGLTDIMDREEGRAKQGLAERKFAETQRANRAKEGGRGSEFGQLTEGLSPEERERARRIKLGLDPRAVTAAAKTVMIGDVPHIFDPSTKAFIPAEVRGQEVTAETVGDSAARVADLTERGKGAGVLANKTITTGLERVTSINGNIRNIDLAIAALDGGAKTGAMQRFLPSIRAASVELDQLRNTLALDVIGSVTFGALSKGELDLAKETALPTGLDEPELRDWLTRRKEAQTKLLGYYQEQIEFLANGGSVPEFLTQKRESVVTNASDLGDDELDAAIAAARLAEGR